jgi:Fe-Mn family superoxide dismutase
MRELIDLIETKKTLELKKLPYSRGSLAPVLSQDNIDFHYGKLARGYVDRFNNKEGDRTFNEAGAFLHNVLFPQFRSPRNANTPKGKVLELINKQHKNFMSFKKNFKEEALKTQGSAWVYLSRSGQIKTIKNHAIKNDIVLLVDMWEHSYQHDYGSNKAKYLDNIWRIINWDVVNQRL